jgi:hypothetical protein
LGHGDAAELLRLARELHRGLQALQTGVARYEATTRAGAGASQVEHPSARHTPPPQSRNGQPPAAADPPTDTDLREIAAQAGVVRPVAQRAAGDLTRPAQQRGLLRQLLAALGRALIRAGLRLTDTPGSTPASAAQHDLNRKIADVLHRQLDELQRQLTEVTARLEAQRHPSPQPTAATGTVTERDTPAPPAAMVTGQHTGPRPATTHAVPGQAATTGMAGRPVAPRPAGTALAPGSPLSSDVLLAHLAQLGTSPSAEADPGEPAPGQPAGSEGSSGHGLDGVA